MKLIELPKDVIELISKHEINVSVAEELFSVTNQTDQSKISLMLHDNRLSSRDARKLVKDHSNLSETGHLSLGYSHHYIHVSERICKSFDKSIISLKLTIKKFAGIAEAVEDYGIFYNILLHHKNMLKLSN